MHATLTQGRLTIRVFAAFVAALLLAVIALHGVASRPSFAQSSQGSAFSAYIGDVAVMTARGEVAKHSSVRPTPVPPLPTFEADLTGERTAPQPPARAERQSRAPPPTRHRTSISLPRAPPAA